MSGMTEPKLDETYFERPESERMRELLELGGVLPVVLGEDMTEAEYEEWTDDQIDNPSVEMKPPFPREQRTGRLVIADAGTSFNAIARALGLPESDAEDAEDAL